MIFLVACENWIVLQDLDKDLSSGCGRDFVIYKPAKPYSSPHWLFHFSGNAKEIKIKDRRTDSEFSIFVVEEWENLIRNDLDKSEFGLSKVVNEIMPGGVVGLKPEVQWKSWISRAFAFPVWTERNRCFQQDWIRSFRKSSNLKEKRLLACLNVWNTRGKTHMLS